MLAKYFLQCDAIGEPINDPDDERRLVALTTSMVQLTIDQVYGYGNRSNDNRRTNNASMHLMVAGKRIMESTQHPPRSEDPKAYARSRNSTSASTTSLLKASACGGGASLLTYMHSDKLAPGETVAHAGLPDEQHDYVEVKPSQEEVARAASRGETKHPAVGDTWLEGYAAMLKPHTRHANYRSGNSFSISQENAAAEMQHFLYTRQRVAETFLPDLNEALQDIRSQYNELPEPHPLEGKSVAKPDFIQGASDALKQMDPDTRRSKAIVAFRKVGFAAERHHELVEALINEAMTVHDYELE